MQNRVVHIPESFGVVGKERTGHYSTGIVEYTGGVLDDVKRDVAAGRHVLVILTGGRSDQGSIESEADSWYDWFQYALQEQELRVRMEAVPNGYGHLQKIAAGLRWVRNMYPRPRIVIHTDEVRMGSTRAQVFWLRLWEITVHWWIPRITIRAHPRHDPNPHSRPGPQLRKTFLTWSGIGVLWEIVRKPPS